MDINKEAEMEVIVKPRQTMADMAIQVYGDIRAVVDIALNNGLSVTGDLLAGTVLHCPDVEYDRYLQNYVRKNAISPATETGRAGEIRLRIFTEEFTKEFV